MKATRLALSFTTVLAVTLVVVFADPPPGNRIPLLQLANLGNLTRVTEKPIPMQPQVAVLCAASRMPDHAQLLPNQPAAVFQVYVTPAAAALMSASKPVFPVGTLILKQKFSTPDAKIPELYTGMIKQEKGFNPKCGDWEFFTLNGAGTAVTTRGKIESCMKCHENYPESDFLSRNYPITLPTPPAKTL